MTRDPVSNANPKANTKKNMAWICFTICSKHMKTKAKMIMKTPTTMIVILLWMKWRKPLEYIARTVEPAIIMNMRIRQP